MRSLLMPVLASLLLLLYGCQKNGDQIDQKPVVDNTAPIGGDLVVEGTVGLGAAKGADVSIFALSNQDIVKQSLLAQAVTDDHGNFELKVPRKFSDQPVLIEVDLRPAQVKCIVISGCDQSVAFGEILPVSLHDLTLRLLVAQLSDSSRYRVGVLSHIASELALAEGKSESGQSIVNANSQLASRLNIIAELPTANMVDIHSQDQLLSANSATLFNTFLESAFLAKCLAVSGTGSISSAVGLCVSQYLDRGIADQSSSPENEVTGAGLLSAMINVYSFVGNMIGRDMSTEKSDVMALRGVALTSPMDQYSKGISSANGNMSLLAKGMDFISTIRQIAASIDLNKLVSIKSLAAFVNGDTTISLADFGVVMGETDLFSGSGFARSTNALRQVAQGIPEVLAEYYRNGNVTEKSIGLTHIFDQGEHKIRVFDVIDGCSSVEEVCPVLVNLTIRIRVDSYFTNANVDFVELNHLVASFEGSVFSDGYSMSFPESSGNLIASFFRVRFEDRDNEHLVSVEIEDAGGEFDLIVALGEEQFSGKISVALSEFSGLKRTSRAVESIGAGTLETQLTRYQLFNLFALSANASGRLTGKSGNDFFASLNVTQSASGYRDGSIEYTETEKFVCGSGGECIAISDETLFSGETSNSFLGLIASVAYRAELKGIAEPVLMRFSGYRKSSVETEISSLKMAYPGHALSLSGKFNNNNGGITSMDAHSLDGINMFIDSRSSGKRYGAVTGPGEAAVADILDMGEWIKITFGDGSFVSL